MPVSWGKKSVSPERYPRNSAVAYGTESTPAVDKIVESWDLFVTLAKRQLYGMVGIRGLAEPMVTMLIAEDYAWSASPLIVINLLKVVSFIALDGQTARQVSSAAAVFGQDEHLETHFRSADY